MPAKGPLAKLALRKYGPRSDDRAQVAHRLLQELAPCLHPEPQILSDQNPHYPGWLKSAFPRLQHRTVIGGRSSRTGFGELKRLRWDPLFSLNHTAAMIRANVNRMLRKTWCTTKKADQLLAHLRLYAHYHNTVLLPKAKTRARPGDTVIPLSQASSNGPAHA